MTVKVTVYKRRKGRNRCSTDRKRYHHDTFSIFNALVSDENIVWSEKSQHIEARDGNNYIFMAIGSTGAIVNNSLITLNTAPYIENGRTMVPVRFVSEALGALVEWDGEKGSVYISR